jgi:hypothetical protein
MRTALLRARAQLRFRGIPMSAILRRGVGRRVLMQFGMGLFSLQNPVGRALSLAQRFRRLFPFVSSNFLQTITSSSFWLLRISRMMLMLLPTTLS